MQHGGNVWEGSAPEKWLDFSANLRPEGPPEWVKQTLLDAVSNARYYPDRSMAAARGGLAAYLGIDAACVLPTAGGTAAIELMLSLEKGTVYTWPVTFGEYARRAAVRSRVAARWEGSCKPGDTVMLCNPNNPTGHALSRKEMIKEADGIAAQGGMLAADEAFIDYCSASTIRHDLRQGIAVVGSLTKTLCIPGVRLGYICAVPELIRKLQAAAGAWPVNAFACAVAAELPRHIAEIQADAQKNARRRKRLTALLEGLGAQVYPSRSNFVLADFGRDMTKCVQALKAQGILVRTCASFGLSSNMLRLAVKTGSENERLIAALQKAME